MWSVVSQLVLLAVLVVIAWHVAKISSSLVRLRVFLDARDIEHRKARIDDSKARAVRNHAVDTWLRDTRAIWGKLFSIADRLRAIGEELVAQDRTTVEMSVVPPGSETPPDEPPPRAEPEYALEEPEPIPEEVRERLSWEALKQQGLIGSTVHAGVAELPIHQSTATSDRRHAAKV